MVCNMKIVIINKSDATGGAAVVSLRLMKALRKLGVDAKMIVCEKLTDDPNVVKAAPAWKIKWNFLIERLRIFAANGFNRSTLFKIDTGSDGLPLWRYPEVKEADAVLINWTNQGMLSLRGIRKIAGTGKKILWTMHDMWAFTGICHHSGTCCHYKADCRKCPLLDHALQPTLASRILDRKFRLYADGKIGFVAVSSWLAGRAAESTLLKDQRVAVIPNAFPFDNERFDEDNIRIPAREDGKIRILFGAARLDDTVKDFPTLIEVTKILHDKYPEVVSHIELVTFGSIKDPALLEEIAIPYRHLGRIAGAEKIRELYRNSDIVVSTSEYETLPGTMVEGQAYGCIPIAFDSGGQRDIIEHRQTGWLADRPASDDQLSSEFTGSSSLDSRNIFDSARYRRALNIVEGIFWAYNILRDPEATIAIKRRMWESAYARFREESIARSYIDLLNDIPTSR